ncbi:MAG: ATP synthase F1 subunit epsilon [Chitinophagales bacterium]
MNVELITPERNVFAGEASRVNLPGIDGLFEILNNHAPLISALKQGPVKITTQSAVKTINITGGFAEVLNNNVIVVAESAKEL